MVEIARKYTASLNPRYFRVGLYIITDATRGRRGRDRMVVGFTTTYAISVYHHWWCVFESRSGRGLQHYVLKLVNKIDRHDISEILLKVTLSTINQTNKHTTYFACNNDRNHLIYKDVTLVKTKKVLSLTLSRFKRSAFPLSLKLSMLTNKSRDDYPS